MNKTVKLNGIVYKDITGTKLGEDIKARKLVQDSIFKAYTKPSQKKINIWKDWLSTFNELFNYSDYAVGVCGFNGYRFSILAEGHILDGRYRIFITPSNNYIVEL